MRRLIYCLCLASLAAGRSGAQELVCAGTPRSASSASISAKTVDRYSALHLHRGQLRALTLFAKFADEAPAARTPPEYASRLFDVGQVGSLSHFYHTMSWGQFELKGEVLPKRYAALHPASAYVTAEPGKLGNYGQFVREVLQQADADVDYTRYDNDGPDGVPNSGDDDGVVDYLFVAVLSTPRGFIIGGATGIATLGLTEPYITRDRGINGIPIQIQGGSSHGSFGGEGIFSQTVGTMAHEFGHALGLPDLYDLNYGDPGEDSAGVGRWCLMGWGAHGWRGDDGPNAFSAWSLKELGWLGLDNERLVEVEGDTTGLEVAALQQGGQVLEIPLPITALDAYNTAQEYLLLEQRTRSGSYYDRHLPGEGLLVWHIRPQHGANNDERAKEVDLVCADGLYQDAGYPLGRLSDSRGGLDNLDFWAHDDAYAGAHQGNMGDATDPFDGAKFTRLEKLGNPSIDEGGTLPYQAKGPGLSMRRLGERMRVNVEQLRWAGVIRKEVHWAGEVLVDGDVQVAPEGRLVIHPGTQVRFAGSDRLHTGSDPGQSELDIQGEFIIKEAPNSSSGKKVVNKVSFEAMSPGQSWYGILVNPEHLSRIEVPESSYELHGSKYDYVLLPGAPPEARGQVVKQFQLVDAPGLETAGNNDHNLQPGETFRCAVELDNWSLVSYEQVNAVLSWNSRLVNLSDNPAVKSVKSTPSGFFPGTQLPIELGPFTLSPDAVPGDSLGFTLKLYKGKTPWQTDKIPFTVQGRYPEHQAQFAVPGQALRGSSVRVVVDQAAQVEAQIQGDITGAELVLRSLPDLTPLAEIPMARKSNRAGKRIFAGQVQLPEVGLYQARLRLRGAGGGVVFSPATLQLWATADQDSLPILAFVGEAYTAGQRGILHHALEQLAAEQHRALYVMDSAPSQAALYQALLPHYTGTQGVVLWLGQSMDRDTQDLFSSFLEGGGRLGLISSYLNLSSGSGTTLAGLAHVQNLTATSAIMVRSLYSEDGIQFSQAHSAMQLLAPAEPVLLDDQQQVAGMRLNAGTYRLVYLPFALDTRNKQVIGHLFESTLAFLRGAIAQAAVEVPGREVLAGMSLLPAGQRVLVRATTGSEVVQARLMVRAFPGMDSVLEVPMDRQAGQFAASFAVPASPGHYHLSLRLRDAQNKSLFNTAGLQVLGLQAARPFVLVLSGQRSARDKAGLQELFTRQAESLGLQIAVLDQDLVAADELYQTLLQRYLAKGKLAVWLGDRMDAPVQAAFRAFLVQSGRLLLASVGLGTSADTSRFMQELVHASPAGTTSRSNGLVRSAGTLEGAAVELAALHNVLDLVPPALPVLRDSRGKVAGLRVDTGVYRLVYLPFELAPLNASKADALVAPLLTFLYRGEAEAAVLEADAVGNAGGLLLTAPGRPVALRVHAPRGATSAGVIAFKVPGMDSVAQAPLNLAQGVFSGEISLPAAGQYLLMPRLSRGDQSFFSGQSLQVAPYLFAAGHQVLAFVDESYTAADRKALKTELEESLQGLGLQADFVDQAPVEGAVYAALLDRYLEPGKLVVWLGRELGPEAQEVFRHFTERGGRLLVVSASLHQRSSPAFLKQVFHIQGVRSSLKSAFVSTGEDFSIRYYPLTIEVPALPALVSRTGEVAGLNLDTGVYRAVYLAFELKNVVPLARGPELLATAFAFLGARSSSQPQVLIKQVVAPGPVAALGLLVPQVVVLNTGSQATARFRVGYQVLRGEKVLISVDREEASLAGGSERTLSLPPWVPSAAVDLRIRFGVKSAAGEWGYLPPQPLRLVEVLSPFAEVVLPGKRTVGNGAGFFDADGDGDLDLYLVRRGEANQLFRNDGKGFAEQAQEAGLADKGLGRGLALGDYDGDGDVDLFLVNEEEGDHLFRNDGAGRFAEVTGQVAADSSTSLADEGSGRSAGFFDSDNDGDLDLYLVNSSDPNRLFVNEGGRFAERAAALGLADEGTGRGLALADWDGDGDVDVLVTIQNGGTQFYRNEGGHFQPLNEALGLVFPEGEVAPSFGDYDNDGDLDLFVSNEWGANQLWRNEAGLAFTLLADSLGQKSTGAGWGDFDSDGDLDLLTTSLSPALGGDQLYQNRGQGSLVPVGPLVNLRGSSNGRGLSFADYDGDGALDIFVADVDSSQLYHNEGRSAHWLEVDLAGPSPNRQGLGARVEVVAGGRRQQRQVFAAFGYASQGPARLHLGLGRAVQVDTLKVRWPDGAQSVVTRLAANQRLEVRHPSLSLAGKATAGTALQAGLEPGYPNPFNASTLIRFQTALAGKVELEIYDLLGQRVRRLVDEALDPGLYLRPWDGRDERGMPVASGVYFCRLHTGDQRFSQRLLLLK